MTGDEVNDAMVTARTLIGEGRGLEARAVLDTLPIAVQASPPVLALRKRAHLKRGRKPKPKLAKEPKPEPTLPVVLTKEGIGFVPLPGAGFAGYPAFRCKGAVSDNQRAGG